MKKVLYVGPYIFPEKDFREKLVHLVFKDLYDSLKDYADEVFLLTSEQPALITDMHSIFEKLKVISVRSKRYNKLGRLKYIREGIAAVFKEDIDIITNIGGGMSYGLDAAVIGLVTRRRIVVRVSGNEKASRKYVGRYKGLSGKIIYCLDLFREILSFNLCHKIIAMSSVEQERIRKIILNKKKVIVCPRGIAVNKTLISRKNGSKVLKVLYVGRKSYEKGFDILMQVRDLLKDKRIRFFFVGDFEKGKEGNTEFLGFIHPDKLGEVYQRMDILALPSRTEGLPQVLLEAMSYGLPCIATKYLFESLLKDGENAILSNLVPEEIAEKIVYLMNNPEKRKRIGMAARKLIINNFNKKSLQKKYRELLEVADSFK